MVYVEHKVVQEPIGSVRRVERKGEYMSGYNRSNLILYSDNDLSQAGNQYIYVRLYPDKTYILCETSCSYSTHRQCAAILTRSTPVLV